MLNLSELYYIAICISFPQKKRPSLSRSVIPLQYYTTLNIFCDICFSFFCSTSACAFLNSSILFNSSSASSNPICVYTFIVTDISECPMRYCNVSEDTCYAEPLLLSSRQLHPPPYDIDIISVLHVHN